VYLFYLYHTDLKKPQRLKYDPVGWDALGKKIKRDTKWHGVFYEYSPKLQFIKDGRHLVHYFYEKYGIEANILITIYKKNFQSRKYDLYYTGRLNLTSLDISTLYASCNIEQTGFVQKLKNRQDVKVNLQSLISQDGKTIPAFTNEYYNITLHSKVIKRIDKLTIGYNKGEHRINGNYTGFVMGNFTPTGSDEITEKFDYPTQFSDTDPLPDLKYLYRQREAGDYTFNIIVDHNISRPTGGPDLHDWSIEWFFIYGKQGDYTTVSLGVQNTGGSTIGFYDKSLNTTVTLDVKDEVYLYGKFSVTSVSGEIDLQTLFDTATCKVDVTAFTTYPTTIVPIVPIHEAFARTVQSITDDTDPFRSTYYGRTDSSPVTYPQDGEGSLRGINNGAINRGFLITQKPIFASFKDLVDTSIALDGIGIGVENVNGRQKVVAEDLDYFYKAERSIQLPWVRDITKTVLDEYYYNELEGGYDKSLNEEVNNLDEINAKRDYVLPGSMIKKKLTLKSPYIASGSTIESMRRANVNISATTDNDRDNDNFIIQLRRDGFGNFQTDRNEDFAELNNVISPSTIYNAKLSPMRCLIRNGRTIRGGLYHQDDKSINLSPGGEGNTEFTSRLNSETEVVSEKTIAVSKLKKPLWIPEVYAFKTKLTLQQLEEIEQKLYYVIEFAADNKTWKRGYLLELEPDPKSNLTTFKLLRANV
jgi:hypothetical protein